MSYSSFYTTAVGGEAVCNVAVGIEDGGGGMIGSSEIFLFLPLGAGSKGVLL